MKHVHSFVLNGQYNLSANGMQMLADELEQFGEVTVLPWDDQGFVTGWIAGHKDVPTVVCGFSLGGNQIGYIDAQLKNYKLRAALAVAFDPSRRSPLVTLVAGEYVQHAYQFDRVICFYNPSTWFYGGSKFVGPNVELVPVNAMHLDVPYLLTPRTRTVEAVRKLAMDSGISA